MIYKKIRKLLEKVNDNPAQDSVPVLVNMKANSGTEDLISILENDDVEIVDRYDEQLEELFLIRNPKSRFAQKEEIAVEIDRFKEGHYNKKEKWEAGCWVYYPWSKKIVHFLSDELHQEIRTTRNRDIITQDEQKTFSDFVIGILGMSVGNSVALSLAVQGGTSELKIADFDSISASNLNRIRAGFDNIGTNKAYLTARQIYEINPYAKIHVFPKAIQRNDVNSFLTTKPRLQLLIDEVDNLEMKIHARIEARKLGIPVVMATDNGDNVLLDIERYDQDKNLPIFHGLIDEKDILSKDITPMEQLKLATKIVGPDNIAPRMKDSLLQVGTNLFSWPQLGGAAFLAGIVVAYAVRKIALKEDLKSGRVNISLDSILLKDYNKLDEINRRKQQTRSFVKKIGL